MWIIRNLLLHWGVCIHENLIFDTHLDNICWKACRQISTLQRLTRLFDLPTRKAIYTRFIFSNFNHCPLVCFFTSRANFVTIQKFQVRALWFIVKHFSFLKILLQLTKHYYPMGVGWGWVLFLNIGIWNYGSVNLQDFKWTTYLSHFLSMSITLDNLRDQNMLIQPLKRTTTFGIKSLAYYWTHLWNILPHVVKGALTLNNLKTLLRKWVGPICGCSVFNLVC